MYNINVCQNYQYFEINYYMKFSEHLWGKHVFNSMLWIISNIHLYLHQISVHDIIEISTSK